MKRTAICWIVLGLDLSVIHGPFWWKEHAEEKCSKGCTVVKAKLAYDDIAARRNRE